jgi:hypothetical protein
MVKYTPQNQLSIELFQHPFERELDKENRWVKLAAVIPWDELAAVYSRKLQANKGRLSVDVRTVIAALIVKHKLRLSDRETVEMVRENVYLQYFCGLKSFTVKPVFDASLFVDIRKRLGGKEFESFNKLVIEKSETIKLSRARIKNKGDGKSKNKSRKNKRGQSDQNRDESKGQERQQEQQNQKQEQQKQPAGTGQQPSSATDTERDPTERPNRGTLKLDATVADQEIKYPTDLNLLNVSRENLERIIDLLYNPETDKVKPRTYRRKARREYLNIAKKKRKGKKEMRRGLRSQLQYVARDLKIIARYLELPDKQTRTAKLTKRDYQLLETIKKVYEQQLWMYRNKTHRIAQRIVSIFQPHVRPIVRGKEKNKTEFGSKINVSEVNGFTRIDTFSWEAYNESVDLKKQVENYCRVYGCYPETVLVDQIYLTRENRKYLKEKGIKTYGKPLGRPLKQLKETAQQRYRKRKKAAQRNHIEAKFGQGKRGYGLNNIKARLPETSESWVNAIFFVMNLTKLLQVAEKYGGFFMPFFKWLYFWLIPTEKIFSTLFLQQNSKANQPSLQISPVFE